MSHLISQLGDPLGTLFTLLKGYLYHFGNPVCDYFFDRVPARR